MNPDDYVSYPLALALKKAGFDWKCDHYYCAFDNETDVRFWSIHPAQSQNGLRLPKDTEVADAPTLAQAQKWLREVKGIDICVWRSFSVNHGYHYQIVGNNDWENSEVQAVCSGRSYEQSLSDAINAALELIEKEGE